MRNPPAIIAVKGLLLGCVACPLSVLQQPRAEQWEEVSKGSEGAPTTSIRDVKKWGVGRALERGIARKIEGEEGLDGL